MSDDLLRLQLAGRIKLRNEFVRQVAANDPIGLEAFKLALGRGEIELGLTANQAFTFESCNFASVKRRPIAQKLMRKIHSEKTGYLAKSFSYLYWRAQFLLVIIPVYIIFLIDVCRYSKNEKTQLRISQDWYGFYPENSTRTRSLASQIIKSKSDKHLKIVVLGRPRKSLKQAEETIANLLPGFVVQAVFPFDQSSVVACAATLLKAHQHFFTWSVKSGYLPTLQETFGGFYRVLSGFAARKWTRELQVEPGSRFVMCHTGLADTSMLEKALQIRGCVTEHWVHGVSDGVNFTGLSTRAFFKSSHDANWHRRLGGYKECSSFSDQGNSAYHFQHDGSGGFLLLSNYAHPMNLSYQINGVRDELNALKQFALAAKKFDDRPASFLGWRPHPVIKDLPVQFKSLLYSQAKELGIEVLSSSGDLRELVLQYQYIVCTQSTVALDVLQAGALPVLLTIQPMDPEHCLAALPLRASGADELVAMWSDHVSDPKTAEAAYLASLKALYA